MNSSNSYPWDVLQIDATSDKKTIKKAYAQLIKLNKPDDEPEKFQEIQEAYNYALQILSMETEESHRQEAFSATTKRKENNGKTIDTNDEKLAKTLVNNVDLLLKQKLSRINKLKNWSFVQNYYALYDLDLKRKVASVIFEKVARYNLKVNSKISVIDTGVLEHLNKVFGWSDNWRVLELECPDDYFNVTLLAIDRKGYMKYYETPDLFRLAAIVVDFLVSYAVLLLTKEVLSAYFPVEIDEKDFVVSIVVFYLLYKLFFELYYPTHRSLGKILLRIYVLDMKGGFPGLFLTIMRNTLIASILLLFLLTEFVISEETIIYTFALSAVVIVSVLTNMFEGGLLHDLISKTRVIKL